LAESEHKTETGMKSILGPRLVSIFANLFQGTLSRQCLLHSALRPRL
jgi:hypothetical protein